MWRDARRAAARPPGITGGYNQLITTSRCFDGGLACGRIERKDAEGAARAPPIQRIRRRRTRTSLPQCHGRVGEQLGWTNALQAPWCRLSHQPQFHGNPLLGWETRQDSCRKTAELPPRLRSHFPFREESARMYILEKYLRTYLHI